MAYDWQAKREFARKMILKYGSEQIFKFPAPKIDPVSGDPIAGNEKRVKVVGISLDFDYKEKKDGRIVDGDVKFLCQGGELEIGMIATIHGKEWRIIDPRPFAPDGVVVFYEVQLRN